MSSHNARRAISDAVLPAPSPSPSPSPSLAPIVVHAVGDVSFARDIARYVHTRRDADYAHPLSRVRAHLADADVTLANLETTVGATRRQPLSVGPNFHSYPPAVFALRDAGVDVVSLANNHSNDYGSLALDETRRWLHRAGVDAVGTRERPFVIVDVRGCRVGLLGAARPFDKLRRSGVNVMGARGSAGVAREQVRRLRPLVDVLIASVHWGPEYRRRPNKEQRRAARELVAAGADVVVGHHPHVPQTREWVRAGGRRGAVFYSLGNFLFDSHASGTLAIGSVRDTAILRMHIDAAPPHRITFSHLPCVIQPALGYAPVPRAAHFLPLALDDAEEMRENMLCRNRAMPGAERIVYPLLWGILLAAAVITPIVRTRRA